MRAEADAEANARKLLVAQEQWGEYLAQKDADASALLARAEALQQLVAQLATAGGLGSAAATAGAPAAAPSMAVAAAEAAKLVEELGVAAAEARASASQLRAETDRGKRSSEQVGAGRRHAEGCATHAQGCAGSNPPCTREARDGSWCARSGPCGGQQCNMHARSASCMCLVCCACLPPACLPACLPGPRHSALARPRPAWQANISGDGDTEMKRHREDSSGDMEAEGGDGSGGAGAAADQRPGFIGPQLPPGVELGGGNGAAAAEGMELHDTFRERARYIPLR